MATWIRSKYPGVYYREHATRKNGPHADRYLTIRYSGPDGRRQEGLGWVSEGWTMERALEVLAEIKKNIRTGAGPITLKGLRESSQVRRKSDEAAAKQRAFTFGEAAARYLAWAKGAKTSWRDDEGRYNIHLKPRLGALPLSNITTTTLVTFKSGLESHISTRTKRRLAPATILQCLALVRQIFNFASETPLAEDDPAMAMFDGKSPAKLSRRKGYGLRAPVIDNARLRVLTPGEVARLLRAARVNHQDHRDIILVGYDCGLRLGELLALKAHHVTGSGESLHIVDTKGGLNRIVYPRFSRKALAKRAQAATGERYLFPGRDGARNGDAFRRIFHQIVNMVGLNDGVSDPRFLVTPHTLRHSHATRLYMETGDLYLVMRRLGHADFSTTKKYIHLAEELAARLGVTPAATRQP